MTDNLFTKAETFIYRNARPLDLARWQYHFEGGAKDAVLSILARYQNADGGFAHALEADSWNPNSSPIQTWCATMLLREIGLKDKGHPIIQGILQYLSDTLGTDGHFWPNTIPSNDEYPHAPWWTYARPGAPLYNPAASLAGFVLLYADENTPLYAKARELAEEAVAYFMTVADEQSMSVIHCYADLMDYVLKSGADVRFDMAVFEEKLRRDVSRMIEKDPGKWGAEYCCKPSFYIASPESLFYPDNAALCQREREFIVSTQQADGSWNITWAWGAYPREFAIAENWWKSNLIMENILFLRAFGEA